MILEGNIMLDNTDLPEEESTIIQEENKVPETNPHNNSVLY